MSVHFIPLHQYKENFKVTDTAIYIPGGVVTANDMACFGAWFEVYDCSAGINGGNPGTITVEYTPDDGTTWIPVPGILGGSVTADSVDINLQATSSTGVFPPVIRFKLMAPANESFYVRKIRRIQFAPGYVASLRSAFSSVTGFGVVANASRVAAIPGTTDVVPVPSATGYNYITRTAFTKTVANDGSALDVNIASAISLTSKIVNYNGTDIIPVFDSGTPANNKGMPVILTAGDALAPVEMGTGADSARTLRTTLSTRHETVTTPLAFRLSDSTEFLTAHETYALNTQFTKAAQTFRLPVSAFNCAWDSVGNTRREVICDSAGNQYVVNRFSYNGTATVPVYDNGTPANNVALPYVQLAGQGGSPVAMGSGADGVTVQRATLSTRHETVTTPLANRISDGTRFLTSHEAVAESQTIFGGNTYRLPVNAIQYGWNGLGHMETLLDSFGATLLSSRHETVTTPLATRLTDGTNALGNNDNVAVAQFSPGAGYKLPTTAVICGWDGSAHRELAVNTSGQVQLVKAEWSKAIVPQFWNFATGGQSLTANVWKEIVASTGAKVLKIGWWNPTGKILEIGFGTAGNEVSQAIITIGDGNKELLIPAGTRISLRCSEAVASDILVLEFLA